MAAVDVDTLYGCEPMRQLEDGEKLDGQSHWVVYRVGKQKMNDVVSVERRGSVVTILRCEEGINVVQTLGVGEVEVNLAE